MNTTSAPADSSNDSTTPSSLSEVQQGQVGGDHYKKYGDLQPWDVWFPWNLNPFQAEAVSHVVRYRDKGEPIQDLRKAIHYIQKLIELEEERMKPK